MVQKCKDNLHELREQISVPEYLFWWASRIFMLLYIIQTFKGDHEWIDYLLPVVVGVGTFAVPLVRLIFPRGSLFSRISFHLQTFVSMMCVAGSVGNYFGLYSVNGTLHYDWILHVISGVPMTMLGYYLLVAMNGDKTKLTPQICACGSMGFSFIVIIAWEIFEYCGDYLFADCNQRYNWEIVPEDPFYNFFMHSAAGTAQLPLADTIVDMATAFFVTIFTGVVLYIVLWRREKRASQMSDVQKPDSQMPDDQKEEITA